MRSETATFELGDNYGLRDNYMTMRELTLAETNEVAGGIGLAFVAALGASGAGSSLSASGSFEVASTNTSALAAISANNIMATGPNNTLALVAFAAVL